MWIRALALAGLLLVVGLPAHAALIGSGDGSGNTTGWNHVGTLGFGLSGIYLGNGWVLTANHVNPDQGDLTLFGIPYAAALGAPVRLDHDGVKKADLKLFRLLADPGLTALTLTSAAPAIGEELILVGNGINRGPEVCWDGSDASEGCPPGMAIGWAWGSGRTVRWGTNRIESLAHVVNLGSSRTQAFAAVFDATPGGVLLTEHEAMAISGDSGGGVFAKRSGVWELAGVTFAIQTLPGQPIWTSFAGDTSYIADLDFYISQIDAIIVERACSDGTDDDGDGFVDLDDPGCSDSDDAFETDLGSICDDGFDADGDGLIDSADPGCSDPLDTTETDPANACDDGIDNDSDGLTDSADPGCGGGPFNRLEDPVCNDGDDNDGDGLIDLDDPQCESAAWRSEATLPGAACGLGFEAALLLAALRLRRRGVAAGGRRGGRPPDVQAG